MATFSIVPMTYKDLRQLKISFSTDLVIFNITVNLILIIAYNTIVIAFWYLLLHRN